MENRDIFEEFMEEFGGAPEAEGEQRFVIDTDAKAEWAIRTIAEEQEERDRLVAVCQAAIDSYREKQDAYHQRFESRTANLRALLKEYFDTVHAKESKTQYKYDLPSGSLILKKGSVDFRPDTDRLCAWLEAGRMTEYLKTEVAPRWALVKKQLIPMEDGGFIFAETGEIIPDGCVTLDEKPARFEVKVK